MAADDTGRQMRLAADGDAVYVVPSGKGTMLILRNGPQGWDGPDVFNNSDEVCDEESGIDERDGAAGGGFELGG